MADHSLVRVAGGSGWQGGPPGVPNPPGSRPGSGLTFSQSVLSSQPGTPLDMKLVPIGSSFPFSLVSGHKRELTGFGLVSQRFSCPRRPTPESERSTVD